MANQCIRWRSLVFVRCSRLDAKYQLPSRKYFSETAIPRLYSSVREKVMEELSSVEYFSGTTDLWSSVGLKMYISYTIHYIDD